LSGEEEKNLDIKPLIEEVLNEKNMMDSRSRKLDIDDFLSLMCAFNAKGFHFVNFKTD